MTANEFVILVDEHDRQLGEMEKLQAHAAGALHRAVSGFLFSPDGKLLIQQRALSKYHSPGQWANSCCSHPRPGESTLDCMQRRFREELGITPSAHWFGQTRYRCDVGDDLVENELVHGFTGVFDGEVAINPLEVAAWRWISREELQAICQDTPEAVAPWLRFYVASGFVDLARENAPARPEASPQD